MIGTSGELQFFCLHLVLILFVFLYVVKSGMSLRIEQVVTQLHQEVITLKARVADQTGLGDAVRAVNNLAKAQVVSLL